MKEVIKFNKKFDKLRFNQDSDRPIPEAMLLQVMVINGDINPLSFAFIREDTWNCNRSENLIDYGIDVDHCLLLIFKYPHHFKGVRAGVFTTIRKYSEKKEIFYKKNIGKSFYIKCELAKAGE